MLVRVINLKPRQDRRDAFIKDNSDKLPQGWEFFEAIDGRAIEYTQLKELGYDTDKWWRDPLLKRTLTKGEIGCFISHWRLWEECAQKGEPMLILEDDAVLTEKFDESWLTGELTYLAHSEQLPKGVDGNKVCYPYWTAAYIITPGAAAKFIATKAQYEIIPVDEFMPRMTDKVLMTFNTKARQRNRSESGTDVEPKHHSAYVRDFTVHNLTCFDDESKIEKLRRTNPSVINVIDGPWEGGTMQGPGGGQKLVDLLAYINRNEIPDHDVIVFTDANDVFWSTVVDEAVGRFLDMKTEFLAAAEQFIWPDPSLRFPPCETKYSYLNSGCFVARVGEYRKMMALSPLSKYDDDQLFMHKAFLTGRLDMKLDYEHYVFATNDVAITINNSRIYNPITRCYSCLYHGNGGSSAKAKFETLYLSCYPELKYASVKPTDYEVIGPDMLLVDFMTPEQCEELIARGEENGSWAPHYADAFPSHDIHIKLIPGLWDEMNTYWARVVAGVTNSYWKPSRHWHLRKAFLMKYSEDTQKTLNLHNDVSLVTGSVKLNEDYEGGILHWPRLEIDNRDIPVGKMILFPGQLTHGHYVDELTSGTKYSMTFWSARFKDDYLDP